MRKLYLLIILALFTSNIFAQYAEVSIKDIQFQTNNALLTAGASNSEPVPSLAAYPDSVIIVSGVVMCAPYEGANPDSTRTLHAGAAAIYLQDPNDRSWSGIMVRDPSGSDAFSILDTGYTVKFKATVNEYNTTTQLNVVDFQGSDVTGRVTRPQPVVLTLDSLVVKGSGAPNYLAEKWEGVYVEFQNVTVTDDNIGRNSFTIFDENNSKIIVGTVADLFRRTAAPLPGTKIEKIRGYIETRTNITGGWFIINPVYENDIVYGEVFPPHVSNVVRDIAEVKYGNAVTISAIATDIDGTVESAQVVYDVNSVKQAPVDMTVTNDSVWSGTIPALNDSSLVSFFVKATDNQGNVSYSPTDTVNGKYFYYVLNRALTIQDVQSSPFGSGYSGYHNYEVTVEGVVTSDTSDIPGLVSIQNGTGAWSGVQIFGTDTEALKKNDKISVTGIVNESFGFTRIGNLDKGVVITPIESGVTPIEPTELQTAIIGTSRGGVLPAESYEGVLVKYSSVTVVDENVDGDIGPGGRNYGEMLIADGTGVGTRVELQDGKNDYHNFWDASLENEPIRVIDGGTFDALVGILFYSHGNFKLVPRNNDDFIGYTDIDDNIEIPQVFSLSQNYPNPFNPTTVIQYSIPEVTNVKLKVYDMLGREIKTLVNREQSAGVYNVQFNAANLSSGVYFYRVEAGSFVASKKLLLLK